MKVGNYRSGGGGGQFLATQSYLLMRRRPYLLRLWRAVKFILLENLWYVMYKDFSVVQSVKIVFLHKLFETVK